MAINGNSSEGQPKTDSTSGADEKRGSRAPERYRGPKLALAIVLLAVAGGLIFSKRAEWAEALDPPVTAGQRPGVGVGVGPSAPNFDLEQTTIPREEIHRGGPPKDGIPALTDPAVVNAAEARYLKPDDRVAGVSFGGEARAYPLRILNWHEIVNDTVGEVPVMVTYCPLCDSVVAFDRRTPDGVKEFGVSGLLYNSNVLMYDRGGEPESLWSQLKGEAVSGPSVGTKLKTLPVELTTWAAWQTRHPLTTVLSQETNHARDYRQDPYSHYFAQPGLMFPVHQESEDLPQKGPVLGVWMPDGTAKAYPISEFEHEQEPVEIRDEIDGHPVVIQYDPAGKSLRVTEAHEDLQWMYSFWFAWYAFYPETEVFESQ